MMPSSRTAFPDEDNQQDMRAETRELGWLVSSAFISKKLSRARDRWGDQGPGTANKREPGQFVLRSRTTTSMRTIS
jgi:hypothetical protein